MRLSGVFFAAMSAKETRGEIEICDSRPQFILKEKLSAAISALDQFKIKGMFILITIFYSLSRPFCPPNKKIFYPVIFRKALIG